MTYFEWLIEQTPERQKASLQSMVAARRLGEADKKNPFSEEAKELRLQVEDYYEKWGD